MQNKYTGDIGDFGKLGLLRAISSAGFSVGVNWYLTPDENNKNDGRHTDYLFDERFRACDEQLWKALRRMVESGQRTVRALERANLIPARYYSELMGADAFKGTGKPWSREAWHKAGLNALRDVDIVFLDPDTGLMVPSAEGTSRSIKYVKEQELVDYYRQGSSVIYYQHKAHITDDLHLEQHQRRMNLPTFFDATELCLKFRTTSQRFFFFIIQPRHRDAVIHQVDKMLSTAWRNHFSLMGQIDADRTTIQREVIP